MADFVFGGDQVTADDLTPSDSNYARMPYIGLATLNDVNGDSPSKKEGKENMEAIQFNFTLKEGDEAGATYRKVEFPPASQDQANSMTKRVAHILAQFIKGDKEEAKRKAIKAIDAPNWNEFKKKVLEVFNEKLTKEKYSAKDDLTIKLCGWIIEQGKNAGKPDFGFTGYIGFAADKRSDKMPFFGTQESQKNQAYVDAITSIASSTRKTGGSTGSDTSVADATEEEEELEF